MEFTLTMGISFTKLRLFSDKFLSLSTHIFYYYCICTVHVIRSLTFQCQHMHNFNVTG